LRIKDDDDDDDDDVSAVILGTLSSVTRTTKIDIRTREEVQSPELIGMGFFQLGSRFSSAAAAAKLLICVEFQFQLVRLFL
jgi:hypothetical protein